MRDDGDQYEYITIYSDDLLVFSKHTTGTVKGLNTLLPLKGVGYPELYLGEDVGNAEINGEVKHAFSACTYIKNVSEKIENIFETKLNNCGSSLEGGYYPEVYTSDILV